MAFSLDQGTELEYCLRVANSNIFGGMPVIPDMFFFFFFFFFWGGGGG